MWSSVEIATQPTNEPVSVEEIKANLRLDGSEQDALIANLAKAARMAVEARLHRTLINTVYMQRHDAFEDVLELYRPPVSVVESVKYYDADGILQTVDAADYIVDLASLPPRIVPAFGKTWPTAQTKINTVEITFTAGYGPDATTVPEPIRQAIIMLASDMYEHPEASVEIKLSENKILNFLLAAYAVPELGA